MKCAKDAAGSEFLQPERQMTLRPVVHARSLTIATLMSVLLPFLAGSSILRAQAADEDGRMPDYVHSLIGPVALLSIGASAAYDQARNSPETWGKTTEGFGKRVASAAGARVANQTVRHGLAAVMDRTTSYTRCTCTSFGGRFGHAIVGAITDRTASGRTTFSEPAIAGAVAGAYAPLLWRPDYTSSQAAQGIGLSLGLSALGNVVSEFIIH